MNDYILAGILLVILVLAAPFLFLYFGKYVDWVMRRFG